MHYSKRRTAQNEKKEAWKVTIYNLLHIAEYKYALNIIIGAGIGGRAG